MNKAKYLFLRIYPRFFATLRMTQGVHFLCEGFARVSPVLIQLPLKFRSTKVDPTSLTLNLRHQSKLTGSNHSFPPNNRQNTTNLNFDYSGSRFSWLHFQTPSLPFRRKTPAYEFRNFVAHSTENQKKNTEKMGFEPMMQITPHNTLAGCRLQPTRPLFRISSIVCIYSITKVFLCKY